MKRLCALAGFLGFAAICAAQSLPPKLALKPCRLEHPARMLALTAECASVTVPVGNGRLGAMVFGNVNGERIQLAADDCSAAAPTSASASPTLRSQYGTKKQVNNAL
mgnify:CR=1 FL=1